MGRVRAGLTVAVTVRMLFAVPTGLMVLALTGRPALAVLIAHTVFVGSQEGWGCYFEMARDNTCVRTTCGAPRTEGQTHWESGQSARPMRGRRRRSASKCGGADVTVLTSSCCIIAGRWNESRQHGEQGCPKWNVRLVDRVQCHPSALTFLYMHGPAADQRSHNVMMVQSTVAVNSVLWLQLAG